MIGDSRASGNPVEVKVIVLRFIIKFFHIFVEDQSYNSLCISSAYSEGKWGQNEEIVLSQIRQESSGLCPPFFKKENGDVHLVSNLYWFIWDRLGKKFS